MMSRGIREFQPIRHVSRVQNRAAVYTASIMSLQTSNSTAHAPSLTARYLL